MNNLQWKLILRFMIVVVSSMMTKDSKTPDDLLKDLLEEFDYQHGREAK